MVVGLAVSSGQMTDLQQFLESTDIVDWQDPSILRLADELSQGNDHELSIARAAFEWVRDNIQHCLDFDRKEVTCSASEVLRVGTGFCYAKSRRARASCRVD